MKEYGFNTTLLHGSEDCISHGATQVPIYQAIAFRHDTADELEKIFANKCAGYSYTRINNPTIESFEKRMTKLEGGIGSVACSSGRILGGCGPGLTCGTLLALLAGKFRFVRTLLAPLVAAVKAVPFFADFVNDVCACHGGEQSYVNKTYMVLRFFRLFFSFIFLNILSSYV